MTRFLVIAALALALSGCSALSNVGAAYNTLTQSTVSIEAVTIADNTFDALEVTAKNYLLLPKCTASNGPVCRDPVATKAIIPVVRSGRVARNNMKQFLRDNPGALGPSGLYNALITATTTLQAVLAQYKAG